MGCNCGRKSKARAYLWSSDPDPETNLVTEVEKRTEVEAMALVARHGGSYEPIVR